MKNIHWLGHASFRIDAGKTIYIDPWKLKTTRPAADIVLITHGHHDHLSPDDISRITGLDTIVVCPGSCAERLRGDVRIVSPGDTIEVEDVTIRAVPSYNTNKPNHPQELGNVGYVVDVGEQRIYHAGDTDLIPEMAEIGCDVALLPVGGTYTMNAEEAAQALALIRPEVAIPMHYGGVVGSRADAERFRELAPPDVRVVIPEEE